MKKLSTCSVCIDDCGNQYVPITYYEIYNTARKSEKMPYGEIIGYVEHKEVAEAICSNSASLFFRECYALPSFKYTHEIIDEK